MLERVTNGIGCTWNFVRQFTLVLLRQVFANLVNRNGGINIL